MTNKPSFWEKALVKYGLNEWRVIISSGGALCQPDNKTIYLSENHGWSMFLHEVAHALTYRWNNEMGDKTGHHSIWGDKFTELVQDYLDSLSKSAQDDSIQFVGVRWGYDPACFK